MFISKLRQRLSRQEGFTLIELLVVLIIIGVLLAIAVPSYLGFKDRAEKRASGSNVRAAVPSVEAYYSDDPAEFAGVGGNSSYDGLSVSNLLTIDAGLKLDDAHPLGASPAQDYCIASQVGNWWGYKHGPAGAITTVKQVANPCP